MPDQFEEAARWALVAGRDQEAQMMAGMSAEEKIQYLTTKKRLMDQNAQLPSRDGMAPPDADAPTPAESPEANNDVTGTLINTLAGAGAAYGLYRGGKYGLNKLGKKLHKAHAENPEMVQNGIKFAKESMPLATSTLGLGTVPGMFLRHNFQRLGEWAGVLPKVTKAAKAGADDVVKGAAQLRKAPQILAKNIDDARAVLNAQNFAERGGTPVAQSMIGGGKHTATTMTPFSMPQPQNAGQGFSMATNVPGKASAVVPQAVDKVDDVARPAVQAAKAIVRKPAAQAAKSVAKAPAASASAIKPAVSHSMRFGGVEVTPEQYSKIKAWQESGDEELIGDLIRTIKAKLRTPK